jgi:hypothetical protein
MQMTPLAIRALPEIFAAFERGLAGSATAGRALRLVARTAQLLADGLDLPAHRSAARRLAGDLGIAALDEPPAAAFSWDGERLRTESEAYVILHEIAHWQICPPDRRRLPDFGLGAGPETGRKADADAARVVSDETKQEEECLASVLGILWEADLGQPAVAAFLEQNWLEGWRRPSAAATFTATVEALHVRGLITADARPVRPRTGSAAACPA